MRRGTPCWSTRSSSAPLAVSAGLLPVLPRGILTIRATQGPLIRSSLTHGGHMASIAPWPQCWRGTCLNQYSVATIANFGEASGLYSANRKEHHRRRLMCYTAAAAAVRTLTLSLDPAPSHASDSMWHTCPPYPTLAVSIVECSYLACENRAQLV